MNYFLSIILNVGS